MNALNVSSLEIPNPKPRQSKVGARTMSYSFGQAEVSDLEEESWV